MHLPQTQPDFPQKTQEVRLSKFPLLFFVASQSFDSSVGRAEDFR